jgi:hypothetical protein
MLAREWVIGRMKSEARFPHLVVVVAQEKVRWVLGVGHSAIEVGGDEVGAGDQRVPCL